MAPARRWQQRQWSDRRCLVGGAGGKLLHPVQVQIIEALGWIDQPLSASDLAEMVDTNLQRSQLVHHLRRLDRIDAIELLSARRCGMRPISASASSKRSDE